MIIQGTCESLGEKIHSVRCSNCQNSLAVKVWYCDEDDDGGGDAQVKLNIWAFDNFDRKWWFQILGSQKKLHVRGDGSEGDLVTTNMIMIVIMIITVNMVVGDGDGDEHDCLGISPDFLFLIMI